MNKEALVPLLDETSRYVLKHGKVISREPVSYNSGESGSDASSYSAHYDVRSLKRNGFEVQLSDCHESRSSGTQSCSWSEKDSRTIEMYLKGKMVVQATRTLGGEKGWSGVGIVPNE